MIGRLFKHDFHFGTYQARLKILLLLGMILFASIMFLREIDRGISIESLINDASFFDLIIYVFIGPTVISPERGRVFELPLIWLGFQMLMAYIIGDYIHEDLLGPGQLVILQSRNRIAWWVSKIAWCICTVLVVYGSTYMCLIACSIVSKFSFRFEISAEISWGIYNQDYSIISRRDFFLVFLILPILTSCVISLTQLILSFFIKPILSYVFIVSIYVLPIYTVSPYLITNYSIPAHNRIFISEGINSGYAILVLIILLFFITVGGAYVVKNKDFIERI